MSILHLELLGLDGESLHISCSSSIRGCELLNLAVQRLPGKGGAKLVLLQRGGPLSLHLTLEEQAVSDQLHYVYSPMDLLGALRFLNGGSGDAQGLTKWAGASELKPLPETLKFLSLSNSFQESLEHLHLPDGLQTMVLGLSVKDVKAQWPRQLQNLTIPGSVKELKLQQLSELTNLSLGGFERLQLPRSLRHLTLSSGSAVPWLPPLISLKLGPGFDLDQVILPMSLQTLSVEDKLSCEKLKHLVRLEDLSLDSLVGWEPLPANLRSLRVAAGLEFRRFLPPELARLTLLAPSKKAGYMEKMGTLALELLDESSWPPNLQELTLPPSFNEPLELPKSLRRLTLGDDFNQTLRLPESLEYLAYGRSFNRSLPALGCLRELILGEQFNQALKLEAENLRALTLGHHFNHPLELPHTLETLKLGHRFNQSLQDVEWPARLRQLTLGFAFNHDLQELPAQLQSLTLGHSFNSALQLPSNLLSLSFGHQYNRICRLPSQLRRLSFGYEFNQPPQELELPQGLEELSFGMGFNRSLAGVHLPKLKMLRLSFNYSERLVVPLSVEQLWCNPRCLADVPLPKLKLLHCGEQMLSCE